MRITLIILLVVFLQGCNKNMKTRSFELVDASITNGGRLNCLKVNKDGKTYIYNWRRYDNRKRYFEIVLTDKEIDSISKMVFTIIFSNPDTLYQCSSGDHFGAEIIVITTSEKKFKFSIFGSCYKEEQVKYIYNLTRYLNDIALNSSKTIDTTFKFESYSKYLLPPPPPPPPG
jgi:hypothetical protein